jgi:hypothetical protein
MDFNCTYRGILGRFCATTLDCDSVTLVLETLRSDETLDFRCLGVWLRALFFGSDFTTDNKLADLAKTGTSDSILQSRTGEGDLHHLPC